MGVGKGDHGDESPVSYTEEKLEKNKKISTGNSTLEFSLNTHTASDQLAGKNGFLSTTIHKNCYVAGTLPWAPVGELTVLLLTA